MSNMQALYSALRLHKILTEDIMNHHAPQGTQLEVGILAHMHMDLYTPEHAAVQTDGET
jgi:hypothetical protein